MTSEYEQVQELRDALQRANDESGRRRHQLAEEKRRHAATRQALREAQRIVLAHAASDRLSRPDYVLMWIEGGLNAVLDDAGHILWSRFDSLVAELLKRQPELGVSRQRDQAGG